MIQSIIGTSFTGGVHTPTFLASNYNPLEGTTITFTISGITDASEGTTLYWWIDGTSPSYSRADQFVENIDNDTLQLSPDGNGALGGTFTLTPNQGDINFNFYIGYSLYGGFLNLSQNITVFNDVNDFTIEWWQKMETSVGDYDALFNVGNNLRFSEQLQGNNLTIWTGNSGTGISNQNIPGLYNTWVHFAIVRYSNMIKLYKNGISLISTPNDSLIQNNSDVLQIANGFDNYFQGYITNFHFLKDGAKYNNNFTPSTEPLEEIIGTRLLLSVTSSNTAFIDTTGNHVASVIGGTWSSESPFSDGSGSLYFDGSSYLGFPGSDDWAIDKPYEPYELALTFDDILNVNFIDDPNNVSDWNTYFDLPNLGSAFDSVQVNGNVVTLLGQGNITLKDQIFAGIVSLISVIDEGFIVSAGYSCFDGCTNLTSISLPTLTTASSYCFQNCTSLQTIDLPELIGTIGVTGLGIGLFEGCTSLTTTSLPKISMIGIRFFKNCTSLTTIYLPVCTLIGQTTGNDNAFQGITGLTISLTIAPSLMTNNSGNPDGDIQYLQSNNDVTISYL